MAERTIWVIGPIAWDTVLYISKLPSSGGFLHAREHQERPGGQAFNVASGIVGAGLPIRLVGALGDDIYAEKLRDAITKESLSVEFIQNLQLPTPHVTILVDDSGERTMVGMEKGLLGDLDIEDLPVQTGDIVVWPFWNDAFLPLFERIREICFLVLGSNALKSDRELSGDILVISNEEIADQKTLDRALSHFTKIYITDGANGSKMISKNNNLREAGRIIPIVDTTGAGDAFLTGVVTGQYLGFSEKDILELATTWASLTVQKAHSSPAAWSEVKKFLKLDQVNG